MKKHVIIKFMYRVGPSVAVEMLPLWLEIETEYAVSKHGMSNPQRSALSGGLASNHQGYDDILRYFHGAHIFMSHCAGESQAMLQASQQLGKYVNSGRALLNVILQAAEEPWKNDFGLLSPYIDDATDSALLGLNAVQPFTDDMPRHWREAIHPRLSELHDTLSEGDFEASSAKAMGLLAAQAQLWLNFTCETGIIAQPGLTSGDAVEWMAN
jgi:hypothetical protein